MKEYKIGEKIVLEVQEQSDCEGCFFDVEDTCCAPPTLKCCIERTDYKDVVFIEVKEDGK